MSKENDDAKHDEARLLRCFKKYEQIVKQVMLLDEITHSIDPAVVRSKLAKHIRSSEASSSSSAADDQEKINQILVETITKFLQELNAELGHHNVHNLAK